MWLFTYLIQWCVRYFTFILYLQCGSSHVFTSKGMGNDWYKTVQLCLFFAFLGNPVKDVEKYSSIQATLPNYLPLLFFLPCSPAHSPFIDPGSSQLPWSLSLLDFHQFFHQLFSRPWLPQLTSIFLCLIFFYQSCFTSPIACVPCCLVFFSPACLGLFWAVTKRQYCGWDCPRLYIGNKFHCCLPACTLKKQLIDIYWRTVCGSRIVVP